MTKITQITNVEQYYVSKPRPIMPREEIAVTTVTLPPSVAYVRGLEGYQNARYRMVQHENTVHINASNA